MLREFIRNENRDIVDTRLVMEKCEWIRKIIEKRKELSNADLALEYIYEKLSGKISKRDRKHFAEQSIKYQQKRLSLESELEELDKARIYDHFTQHDLGIKSKEYIEFTPITSSKQKVKQIERPQRKTNVMITLNPNDYKK
ncbi:MAG: hypothetical protein E7157_05125 [Lactobacillales bacterium]|nr:hypothetical protein [Lactobacillales bacterium]